MRGHHHEGRRWIEETLEASLPLALRARALLVAATMAYTQGDYHTAEERWGEALRLSQSERDVLAEAYAWAGIGLVEMVRPDFEAASSRLEKALALFERCGEDYMMLFSRVFLGTTLLARGDAERAKRMFEEGLAAARRLKSPSLTYVALYNLAQLALARGDLEAACRMLGEGIELNGQTKDRANLAHFMEALSAAEAFRGEAERSAVLIGAAESSLREVGAPVYNFYIPDPSLRERAVAEARASLGDTVFEQARERGRAMTFDQTIEYALGADETPATTAP
jgi:non-specific serine/threonine protein kinase